MFNNGADVPRFVLYFNALLEVEFFPNYENFPHKSVVNFLQIIFSKSTEYNKKSRGFLIRVSFYREVVIFK